MSKRIIRLSPTRCPIVGQVKLPGSKSYSNRAMCIAAVADGASSLINFSDSDDSLVFVSALKELGGKLKRDLSGVQIEPIPIGKFSRRLVLNMRLAGTTSRFLTAMCSVLPGIEVELTGERRLLERPIGDLVEALRGLGGDIEYLGTEGCLPLKIKGQALVGGSCKIPGNTSSQYLSALLMIAPLLSEGLEIEVVGELTSQSYVDMTLAAMSSFGVEVENRDYQSFRVAPGSFYQGREYRVEGDATGAGYFWGISAISRGRVRVYGLGVGSYQGDVDLIEILAQIGCRIESGQDDQGEWVEVFGATRLQAIERDLNRLPDSAQTLSVIAACAEGTSRFTGLHTLRVKETDRLAALHCEFAKLGVMTETGDDWIAIHGGGVKSGRIATYDDHRMAMSFAMLGGILPGIEIEEPEVVSKSFPSFWEELERVGIVNTDL